MLQPSRYQYVQLFNPTGSDRVHGYICVDTSSILIQVLVVVLLTLGFEYLNLQQLQQFFPLQHPSLLLVEADGLQPSPN